MSASRTFVLVTSSFPIRNDGSEAAGSFVVDLAEELAEHVLVRVVAPGLATSREQWSPQVEVFRYAAPVKPLSTLKPWLPGDFRWIVRVMRGGLSATRAAIGDGTSHVLALWALPCGEWVRRAVYRHSIGYSVWMLGSDVWSLGRIPVLRGSLARVIREARHAYADGYQLAKAAQQIGKVPVKFLPSTRRISVVDPLPSRVESPYRLVFLGRWHRNKGVDLLLDALASLDDSDWLRIQCVEIYGGGPLQALVHERVAALQSEGRQVRVGGFLVKADAEAAIMHADWLVIPSRIESIPLIFSDAMKLGCPVIATPVGDLPQLLETYMCGVLADSADAAGIAKALKSSLRSNAADFRTATRHAAEEFSMRTIVGQLLQASGRTV